MRTYGAKALILCLAVTVYCYAQDARLQISREKWNEDLDVVVNILKTRHLGLYYRISSEDFANVVAQALEKIKSATCDEEAYVAVRQVVCSIRDGHSYLGTSGIKEFNIYFPLRLFSFRDGVFITAIDKNYSDYLGARVLEYGNVSIEKAFELAGTITSSDNQFGRLSNAPRYLANARMLRGLKIIDSLDSLSLKIVTRDGQRKELTLSSFVDEENREWFDRQDTGPLGVEYVNAFSSGKIALPIYMKHVGEHYSNYAFEHLKAKKVLYMQFNMSMNQQGESFSQFFQRMFDYADSHKNEIDKMVIDIRFNPGGNGAIILPFVNEIIKRDWINQQGKLFVLTSRATNSAAVLLMGDMDLHTNVTFVGEPAMNAFNMFSISRDLAILPNSKYHFLLSTGRFSLTWPANDDLYVCPDVPVVFTSADYFAGKDPVLDTVLSGETRSVLAVLQEDGAAAAKAFVQKQRHEFSDLEWWTSAAYQNFENQINAYGYNLMNGGDPDRTIEVFEFNTWLFPESFNVWDSLAEAYMNQGNKELAIKYYKKSLALNPDNNNAVTMIQKLEQE